MSLEDDTINNFLQLLEQSEDPLGVLANVAQFWLPDGTETGNAGDIYAKIHQEGDPGNDTIYKLLDFAYATFFGEKYTVTAAATVNLIAGNYNLVYCDLDQDVTFNITGGTDGQRLYFVLEQDATGGRVVTFNTNFVSSGSRTGQANEKTAVGFIYDGTDWVETTGGLYGIKYGQEITWIFKMVDSTDFATPETGLSPSVQISKDGGALGGLTGSPAVSEIGNGWYKVITPAVDMAVAVALFVATATGAAQTDEVFYTS